MTTTHNTDGSEDIIRQIIDDKTIKNAIENSGADEGPTSLTVNDTREYLTAINDSLVWNWAMHLDTVEQGNAEIVHEDACVAVLTDPTDYGWDMEIGGLDLAGRDERTVSRPLKRIHHEVARKRTHHVDASWSTGDSLVLVKPRDWRAGELHVLRRIAQLARKHDGRLPHGVDLYAITVHDLGQREWSEETGRSHSAAGNNVRAARRQD